MVHVLRHYCMLMERIAILFTLTIQIKGVVSVLGKKGQGKPIMVMG